MTCFRVTIVSSTGGNSPRALYEHESGVIPAPTESPDVRS